MSETSFLARLPGAFAWPLQRPLRIGIVAAFALAMGFFRWLPWSAPPGVRKPPWPYLLVAVAFLAGGGVSWLFGIVRRTTHADDRRPETFANEIDKDDAWEDLLQFLGAFLVSYLPLLGFLGYVLAKDGRPFGESDFRVAVAATAVAGTAYFPMALLLLGFSGDWRAGFNLPLGLRGMGRLGSDYAFVVALFLAAGGLSVLLELGWARQAPLLSAEAWVARTSTAFAELYLGAVAMRALGLLYLARGERLGWVARSDT